MFKVFTLALFFTFLDVLGHFQTLLFSNFFHILSPFLLFWMFFCAVCNNFFAPRPKKKIFAHVCTASALISTLVFYFTGLGKRVQLYM